MGKSLPDEGYYLTSDNITDYYTWVEVDGEPLQVYGMEEKENKIFGYIEAQEGKQFIVHCADLRTTAPEMSFCTRIYVDGTKCNGSISRKTSIAYRRDAAADERYQAFSGKETSQTTEQPFIFSKLQLTDDDDAACNDENAIKSLGTLRAVYQRIRILRSTGVSADYAQGQAMKFHEKAKKAQLSHQASFGENVAKQPTTRAACELVDEDDHPLETFEFRYRSRQLLQLEGFIPDSPEPSPDPSPSPVPQVADSPSPAQAPASPIASTSNARPVERSNGASSGVEADERQRIARLEAELESLRRQERIATLERELLALRNGASTSASGGASSSHKIKADPDERTDIKRVKREAGEASSSSQASSSGKGKGKAKEKPAIIELSDSE